MKSESELKSLRRTLKSFTNIAKRELNWLRNWEPETEQEGKQLAHTVKLLHALTASAEHGLEFIEYILGSSPAMRLRSTIDAYKQCVEMDGRFGTMLVRFIDPNQPVTDADYDWAVNRKMLYDTLFPLLNGGRLPPVEQTPESMLRNHAFKYSPEAKKVDDRDEEIADAKRTVAAKLDADHELKSLVLDVFGMTEHDYQTKIKGTDPVPAPPPGLLNALKAGPQNESVYHEPQRSTMDVKSIAEEAAAVCDQEGVSMDSQECRDVIDSLIERHPGFAQLLDQADEIVIVQKRK
jgi:hypothetical protein